MFHYAHVPLLCMDCARVSNFPSEKRSRHSVAKINYADGDVFRNVVVWVCSDFSVKKTKLAS